MNTELMHLADRVISAGIYLDLFGVCDGGTSAQTAHVKKLYRRFALILHPERYPTPALL